MPEKDPVDFHPPRQSSSAWVGWVVMAAAVLGAAWWFGWRPAHTPAPQPAAEASAPASTPDDGASAPMTQASEPDNPVDALAPADTALPALADVTRRDIVTRTLEGEHSVSALARHYPMSFAAVQKHVAVLERAGLLTKRRQGREALASGDVQMLRSAGRLLAELEEVWRGRISRIDDLLNQLKE